MPPTTPCCSQGDERRQRRAHGSGSGSRRNRAGGAGGTAHGAGDRRRHQIRKAQRRLADSSRRTSRGGRGGSSGGGARPPGRPLEAYAWLAGAVQHPSCYVPQLGDGVVYLWQGHCALLDATNDKRSARPWEQLEQAAGGSSDAAGSSSGGGGLRPAEPCEVVGLEYFIAGGWGVGGSVWVGKRVFWVVARQRDGAQRGNAVSAPSAGGPQWQGSWPLALLHACTACKASREQQPIAAQCTPKPAPCVLGLAPFASPCRRLAQGDLGAGHAAPDCATARTARGCCLHRGAASP